MNVLRKILIPAIAITISACGSSSDPVRSAPDTGNSETNAQTDTPVTDPVEQAEALALVDGVYNTSREADESYLHIDSKGSVTAYDYIGDSIGTGENCYQITTSEQQTNNSLNGGTVTYSASTDTYTLSADTIKVEFSYLTETGMSDFVYNGILRAGTGLNFSSNNLNLKIGGDGRMKSTVLITDIQSLLCN